MREVGSAVGFFSEYWNEHVAIKLLYTKFVFSDKVFYRGVPGFATDCPCGVCWRGLTTFLLFVRPLSFGYLVFSYNRSVSLA